jgi:tRNA pseudouridine38-40 synthase
MRRMVLVLEYDGTNYCGFQWQTGLPTIQSEVEAALNKLTGEPHRVAAASRTDSGVHARGQVATFLTGSVLPHAKFVSGLNYYLPLDIAVKAAHEVRGSFNVRRAALSREYRYYIVNEDTRSPLRRPWTLLVTGKLNIALMNQACQALLGEHDFMAFASALELDKKQSTVRRVMAAKVTAEAECLVFQIIASSFLPHQVRNTVGALLQVGRERMSLGEFCSIIESKVVGRGGPAAPASGLCLIKVNYAHPFEEEENENL